MRKHKSAAWLLRDSNIKITGCNYGVHSWIRSESPNLKICTECKGVYWCSDVEWNDLPA